MDYENPWIYEGEVFTSEMIGDNYGFVYILINKKNNKKYIGKKFFYSQKTKQVKGKKKRSVVESDWKVYYGSNKNLLEDIVNHGTENIERIILKLCKNKTTTNYYELKEQVLQDVLLNEDYYNEFIGSRITGKYIYE